MDEQYDDWCKGGPWFNETICHNIRYHLFEELFVTAREDIYGLMCELYAYNQRKKVNWCNIFFGGHPLTSDSNLIPLISLCVTIISFKFELTHWIVMLHGVVWHIRVR